MAPTFPTTFDRDQSPLTPMSAASGSNTPISYKANVNRNKTKKWADAKPVDYGGDDWGDDDEYDPHPPAPKPTGLRQQGQGLQSGPPSASTPSDKKNYGELPPLPGAAAGPASARPRLNSFDADDEKRNFSNATMRQSSTEATPTPTAATRFSQITGVPSTRDSSGPPALFITTQQLPQHGVTGLRKGSQVVSPTSGSPHPDVLLPGSGRTNTGDSSVAFSVPSRVNTGESGSVYSQPTDTRTPSSDYQARRDFSPTAVPAPLSTTRSVPPSAIDPPSSRFPARKSSMSQAMGPDLSPAPPAQEPAAPKPWVADRSSSPGAAARSPTTPSGKALPFIRPADIYRRVEEQKEKERQSMESSRPSMDSLVGAKSSDRSDSPAKPPLREKTSSDSLNNSRQRTGLERDDGLSSSGRHLQPMLEPVKERKSEYGFEGFNMNDQAAKAAEPAEQTQPPSESTQLDMQDTRGLSVSPKLPDLNRMSGFGIDLFSQPKSEDHEPPLPLHREPKPTPALSAPSEDIAPGRQPSLGYRSAVNQAFDRKDDSSVPPTPASQTGSGVRRSDSESTGTTGISPIMSRAPSGAVSDVRGREGAAPSMLEVVHEPVSPIGREEFPAGSSDSAKPSSFQPGYRGDVRTPSPGNSPARKPDLAKTEAAAEGYEAVLADPSSQNTSKAEDGEPLYPPRPIAERDGSFRPSLPGGWTSYATTSTSETPQQDSARVSKEVDRAQTPTSQISSTNAQHDEADHNITPTSTKHSLPHSTALGVAAGAALGGGAGAFLARHDEESSVDGPISVHPAATRGNGDLPTPDPAMAPSGNVYSSTPLDPRLLPKLESVSPEAQLRPAPVQTDSATDSSDAPTPPAKDTPYLEDSEDFPKPTVPLKQRTMDEVDTDEILAPPMRPQVLPTLSTDTRPQDEESDKLRKEIINSLSPKPSDAAPRHESLQPDQPDQTAPNDGRFSYLPREYDNYWATTSEDAEPASLAEPTTQTFAQIPPQSEQPPQADASFVTEAASGIETPPIPPFGAQRTSMSAESRRSLPHRFSWETSAEDVSLSQSREQEPEVPAIPSRQDTYQEQASQVPAQTVHDGIPTASSSQAAQEPYFHHGNVDYDKELGAQGLTSPVSEPSDDGHTGRDAALLAGGAALGGAAAATAVHSQSAQTPSQYPPQRRLSLAEEKDPRVSSYPVSPTPPEDDHPSRSPQAYFSGPSAEQPVSSAAPSSVSPINSPVKTQFSPASRILAFKEIAAMKNPHQRIETFDEMRHRFATMDSGLFDWMTKLKAQHPEHANATGTWSGAAFPTPDGSARSKYSKANATGQAPPPSQQPYYQQYLNASSSTPGTPVSRPGPSVLSGSQQGFSPAGGKLTSQQVQAKGKELLHTAGIFGGKAGKAGKGLLAKGKNKLRGSGAGDKTSPNVSPSAKLKNDRRTSWGFPIATSRSSGRPDVLARESKESIPMPMVASERQRAETTDSQGSLPALESPTTASRDSPILMSGAVNSPELQTVQSQAFQSNEPTPAQGLAAEYPQNEEFEERDHLGIPAPITKNQPSWDPFNATPIAEEEGYQYEDGPTQKPQSMHPAPQKALAIPEDATSKSERSNSGDAPFYDAPEELSDLNDWVMVSSDPEAKQAEPKEPKARPVSEIYQPPEGPPPGFLERQQTQPVPEPQLATAQDQQSTAALSPLSQRQVQPSVEPSTRPESEIYQPPEGPPPGFLSRQQTNPVAKSEIFMTLEQPSTSVTSQPQLDRQLESEGPTSHEEPSTGGRNQQHLQDKLRPEVSQPIEPPSTGVLNRPRFSYEAPLQSNATPPTYEPQGPSQYPPTPQNIVHNAGEQQSQQEESQEPTRNSSFKGLPPIRRTSTFGLGFGRRAKPRFPIDDEGELSNAQLQHEAAARNYEAEIGATAGAVAMAAYPNQQEHKETPKNQIRHTDRSSTNLAQQRKDSMDQPGQIRPELNQAHSSDYSPRSVTQTESQSRFQAPRAADAPPEAFRRSQDAWRPSSVSPPTQSSPVRSPGSAMAHPLRPSIEQQRSMEGQRSRGFSESSQSTTRPDLPYNDRGSRPVQGPPIRPMLYDQPPSSAQRYPELFQTQQQPLADLGRDGELPPHMYQAPIPREATFLPRQQTNEYQLPGVGPPAEEPRPDRSRRNSAGFLKDLGGRISRGTSRERGNSVSRDGGMSPGGRGVESRGYEYSESSIASEEAQEQQKRRSSFFGSLNRASTTGLDPPQSRESVVAHFPGSRTDLLGTPTQFLGSPDRKRSFFGAASPSSPKLKPNKLTRSSTSGMLDEPGKKKRFSGLSSMFGRNGKQSSRASVQERPQPTRELSYNERQPLESPQFDQSRIVPQTPPPQSQNQNPRRPSQSRQLLTKISTGGDPSKSREDSKNRRQSASNLLSGIMGRKSEQKDRGKEDSSSQGTATQPINPQKIPLGQTYTDLQDETPQAPLGPPLTKYQERPTQPQPHPQERGRRASKEPPRDVQQDPPREPQYDSVPIPSGYSLVRGQGAMTVPTEYDPRGLTRFQQSQQPGQRYAQQQQQPMRGSQQDPRGQGPLRQNYGRQTHQPQPEDRRTSQGTQPPALSPVETYDSYTKRSSPHMAREDLLARSPARDQTGQQRPYQLSLPEDEEDREPRPMSLSNSHPIVSLPSSARPPQHQGQPHLKKHPDAIQRLQQPVLRHPESPAGYPLPDDAVFSPVNEAARNIPPPPPPKWPSHLDRQQGHSPNQLISTQHLNDVESELDRSNTRRTALSAVSGMSGPQGASLNVPRKEEDGGRDGITPSPTPPSPAYTPERAASPPRYSIDEKELERGLESERQDRGRRLEDAHQSRGNLVGNQNIRTTTLNRGPSPDLYNASPRLPHPVSPPNARIGNGYAAASSRVQGPNNVAQTSGVENAAALAKAKSISLPSPGTSSGNAEGYDRQALRTAGVPKAADAREEKIYYDAETGEEGDGDGGGGDGVTMSATSYPGQEWNPYIGGGGWEEGFD